MSLFLLLRGMVPVVRMSHIHRCHEKDIDEHMDDESGPERVSPVTDVAEPDAGQDGAYRLQTRFAQMNENKRDGLDEYASLSEPVFQTEKKKAAEEELGGEEAGER